MKKLPLLATLISATLMTLTNLAAAAAQTDAAPRVELKTSKGSIILELNADKSPVTVKNFLTYVEAGFYDGTIFHRVIPGFMAQGGGFTTDLLKKPVQSPIQNEADNGLKNDRGTVAMARTGDPHSATAQFFINTVNNDFLNHTGKNPNGWGYAVFGKVVQGMNVVEAIEKVPTGMSNGLKDVPLEAVLIEKATHLPAVAAAK